MTDKPQADIVWRRPAALTGPPLVKALADALATRVAEAYLFGSHARGAATEDSDIDLALVCDTTLPWVERARPFLDLTRTFGPIDFLVYTPDEWRALQANLTGYVGEMLRGCIRVV